MKGEVTQQRQAKGLHPRRTESALQDEEELV